jgi:hypothetical protein
VRLSQCLQFQAAKGAPSAPKKADNHRTAIESFGEADEIAGVAPEPEQWRSFTGLYRSPDQTRLHQFGDGARQGCDDTWRSAGLESALARIKLCLQGHVATSWTNPPNRGASLISGPWQQSCRGNIIHSKGE